MISKDLACGRFQKGATQQVDGVDAVKLTESNGRVALWFNPATYLPVRLIVGFGPGRRQTDFGWLSPTPATMAQFQAQVPAGFRQVHLP